MFVALYSRVSLHKISQEGKLQSAPLQLGKDCGEFNNKSHHPNGSADFWFLNWKSERKDFSTNEVFSCRHKGQFLFQAHLGFVLNNFFLSINKLLDCQFEFLSNLQLMTRQPQREVGSSGRRSHFLPSFVQLRSDKTRVVFSSRVKRSGQEVNKENLSKSVCLGCD